MAGYHIKSAANPNTTACSLLLLLLLPTFTSSLATMVQLCKHETVKVEQRCMVHHSEAYQQGMPSMVIDGERPH
jgi:hypothetical protein